MFKIWSKESKCWVGGLVTIFQDGTIGRYSANTKCFDILGKEEFEIVKYTGFKDKNGNKIYEGDIIRRRWFKGEDVRYVEEVITFDIGAFWCVSKGGFGGEMLGSHLTKVIPSQIEVISNIYENPELLNS